MMRTSVLMIALLPTTGCLLPYGSGYGHSSSGLKGPVTEILYSKDEPIVMMVVDGNCGLEVKQKERNLTGMFTVGDDKAIIWYFEPSGPDYKQAGLWVGQGKALLPETTGWQSQQGFDTAKGNLILIRWDGSNYTANQTMIDQKKLRAIAKEHRSGFMAQEITLESEKTWKIAAGHVAITDFLQESRNGMLVDGKSISSHVLRENGNVQTNFDEYRTEEGPQKRGVCFNAMATAIEETRRHEVLTQGEVVSYLGEPDHVAEYVTHNPGAASTTRLVYTYRLTRGNVKGHIVGIDFEDGRFTKYHYYPEPRGN